jgi:hypothetical protein
MMDDAMGVATHNRGVRRNVGIGYSYVRIVRIVVRN